MQGNYHDPQYSDSPRSPLLIYALTALLLLALIIGYYAATATPRPGSGPPVPPTTTGSAAIAEHRLLLQDGRIILCLEFPDHAVTCDWTHTIK